jgi:hypothetical protein
LTWACAVLAHVLHKARPRAPKARCAETAILLVADRIKRDDPAGTYVVVPRDPVGVYLERVIQNVKDMESGLRPPPDVFTGSRFEELLLRDAVDGAI